MLERREAEAATRRRFPSQCDVDFEHEVSARVLAFLTGSDVLYPSTVAYHPRDIAQVRPSATRGRLES